MKNEHYITHMKGLSSAVFFISMLLLGFSPQRASAQVATLYLFSQSNGTYVPITGGTAIATATGTGTSADASLDQGNYTVNIGFPFAFNGVSYTTCNANGNGYITFGSTLPTTSATTPISATVAYAGAVAAMARDLWGVYGSIGTRTSGSPTITGVTDFTGIATGKELRGTGIAASTTVTAFNTSAGTITMSSNATATSTATWVGWPIGEIRVETIGSAPNRTCVIQYSGMSDWVTSGTNGNNMAFQIRLNEAGGVAANQSIDIVYGPQTNLLSTAKTQQVGLRGATNADFNNRSATTTWNPTTAGTSNTASVTRTNTIFPASGLTFTWVPPAGCTGTPTPGTASTSNSSVCTGAPVTITVTGYPTTQTGISLQWQESSTPGGPYTDISGATSASYTNPSLSSTTYYVCKVICANGGASALTNEVGIVTVVPTITGSTPATRCGTGTVTLNATASAGADVKWYAAATGGSALGTGSSFTTPAISATTDYYAAATFGGSSENMPTPSVGTSLFWTATAGWGLRFTVNATATINTVNMYPSNSTAGAASLQVKITDLSDVVLYTGPVHNFTVGTTSALVTVPVNITVPPGNYKMVMTSTGINNLVRESGGVTFPYTSSSNAISITAGANGTGTAQTTSAYYWFYAWNISTGCESARTAVTATVTPAPALNVAAADPVLCSGGTTTVSVNSSNDPNYTYSWTSAPAGFTASGNGPHSVSPTVNTTYTVNAIDNSGGSNNGCVNSGTVTIVSGTLASGTLASSQSSYCVEGSPVLTLTGASGGSIQLQESTVSATGPWTNIGNGSASYTPASPITQTTYYRAVVSCPGNSATSNVVTVNVNPGYPGGTYTINSGAATGGTNFHTFGEAIAVLSCGMASSITFNVTPGTYNEQVIIPVIPGASPSRTLTINGNGATLNYESAVTGERAVIKLNGADYVTIQNLNITSLNGTYGFGIQMLNDADHNTVSNCTININQTSTSTANFAGILINSSASGITTAGNSGCDHNMIVGNTVSGGYAGISVIANGTTNTVTGNVILNNTVRDFHEFGIMINGNDGVTIEGNDISRPNRSTLTTFRGIRLTSANLNAVVTKNRIHDPFTGNLTSTAAAFGIHLSACDATAGNENVFSNNIIYNFLGGTGNHNGVLCTSSDYAEFYHNTVDLADQDATCSACGSRGFYMETMPMTGLVFKNNVVSITKTGTGSKQCIYFDGTSTTGYVADGNDYYMGSTQGTTNNIALINAVGYNTLAAWQAATSQDASSASSDPIFYDASTGNLRPTSTLISSIGVPTDVAEDILGSVRSVNTPSPGAYEYNCGSISGPSNISVSSVSSTGLKLSFTRGGGSAAIVIVKAEGAASVPPAASNAFTVSTPGDAANAGNADWNGGRVIYNSSLNPSSHIINLTVKNLYPGVKYYFRVYEYNNGCMNPVGAGIDTVTLLAAPKVKPTVWVDTPTITANGFKVKWTNGDGAGRLVVLKKTNSIYGSPVDSHAYTANAAFGTGDTVNYLPGWAYNGTQYVVAKKTGRNPGGADEVTVTNLEAGSKYNVMVYEFNGGASYNNGGAATDFATSGGKTYNTTLTDYIAVKTAGVPNAENFDTLGTTTANSKLPSGWHASATTFTVDAGTSSTAGMRNYGATGASDRALGSIGSGKYGVKLKNTGKVAWTSLVVKYTAEQWRNGGVNLDNLSVEYSNDAYTFNGTNKYLSSTAATWNSASSALTFNSSTASASGALDGNLAANRSEKIASIITTVNPGESVWIRWVDGTATTSDGMAADDVEIIPFTTTLTGSGSITAKSYSDLNIASGTWTLDTNGLATKYAWNMENGAVLNATSPTKLKRAITFKSWLYGTGMFTTDAGGAVTVDGDFLNQHVYFTPGSQLGTLAVKGNATATINSVAIASYPKAGSVKIGELTGNGTLTVTGTLTLNSDTTGTATIGTIYGGITGNVKQQLALASRDAIRLFSHPFNAPLMLATITNVSAFDSAWYYAGNAGPVTIGGMANSANWTWITSPTQTNGVGGVVRGSKANGGVPVKLDATGLINQGNVTISKAATANDSFITIGNPYPAGLILGNALATATNFHNSAIWTWDPSKGTKGVFTAVPNAKFASLKLPSGSAFVARAFLGTTASFSFTEADKTSSAGTKSYFREDGELEEVPVELPEPVLPEGLQLTIDQNGNNFDGLYVYFNGEAKASAEMMDAPKIGNPGLNFYTKSAEGNQQSVDVRPFENGKKVVLGLNSADNGQYTINVSDWNMQEGTELYLVDTYTGKETLLNGKSSYTFEVNGNAKSQGEGRMYLRMGRVLSTASEEAVSLELVPNPAKEMVTIRLNAPEEGKAIVRVLSVTGQQMVATEMVSSQHSQLTLPLNNLAAGAYMVEVTVNGQKITKQLIKQ